MYKYYEALNVFVFFASNPLMMYVLLAWSLFWKGLALWKSARRGEKWWFIVLLVINTVGLLEILYLFVFSRYERKTIPKDKQIMEIKPEEKG